MYSTFTMTLDDWIVSYPARPNASLRLLCFPHAGGTASAFAGWGDGLPLHLELCALRMPGRGARDGVELPTSIQEFASELVSHLRPIHDRPVAIVGYSMGAVLGFEYARALRAEGHEAPCHIFVIARGAPQLDQGPGIAHLGQRDFVTEIREQYGGIPDEIVDSPELLEYFLPPLRADMEMIEAYRYDNSSLLECGLSALGGEEDVGVSDDVLRAWSDLSLGSFDWRRFKGGHFFAADPEARGELVNYIVSRVDTMYLNRPG